MQLDASVGGGEAPGDLGDGSGRLPRGDDAWQLGQAGDALVEGFARKDREEISATLSQRPCFGV